MRRIIIIISITVFLPAASYKAFTQSFPAFHTSMHTVHDIPVPAGYERVPVFAGSFASYLRQLPLRAKNIVYYYNGQVKPNQSLHYAVVDISTGDKDLQQCAYLVRERRQHDIALQRSPARMQCRIA
jgi:hypothetical protein